MKPESLVFAAAGTLFGVIVGWILGAQQATMRAPTAPAAVAADSSRSRPRLRRAGSRSSRRSSTRPPCSSS